jgi:hypothetical protein
MKFTPETTAEITLEWLMRQLDLIASEELHDLDVLHAAPTKVRIGRMVYADGTDWNPGSGEGVYVYTSGGWSKL